MSFTQKPQDSRLQHNIYPSSLPNHNKLRHRTDPNKTILLIRITFIDFNLYLDEIKVNITKLKITSNKFFHATIYKLQYTKTRLELFLMPAFPFYQIFLWTVIVVHLLTL